MNMVLESPATIFDKVQVNPLPSTVIKWFTLLMNGVGCHCKTDVFALIVALCHQVYVMSTRPLQLAISTSKSLL